MSDSAPKPGERRGEIRIRSVNLINYSAQHANTIPEKTLYVELGTAQTLDLSASGCRLKTTREIPAGIDLTFDMQLGEQILKCRGRTLRANHVDDEVWEVGVEFRQLDDLAQDAIRLYLQFKENPEEA